LKLQKGQSLTMGAIFDFDEREVAWAIIRLLEKGIVSSIFMGPAEDLPKIGSSIVPAIKTVKVNNNDALVSDALAYDAEKSTIIVRSDLPILFKSSKCTTTQYDAFPGEGKKYQQR
jgi:hypothetical protein